jgi:hypothetical protein
MYASIVRNSQLVHVACTHIHFTNYHLMQETLNSHDCWEPGNEMEGKVTSNNINRLLHFQLNIIHIWIKSQRMHMYINHHVAPYYISNHTTITLMSSSCDELSLNGSQKCNVIIEKRPRNSAQCFLELHENMNYRVSVRQIENYT